jgi:hypothetical protein
MILQAATPVTPRRANFLGGVRCQEIPQSELTDLFGEVVLVDLDRVALDEAVDSAQIRPEQAAKLRIHVADLTGRGTQRFLADVAGALRRPARLNPADASRELARLADECEAEIFKPANDTIWWSHQAFFASSMWRRAIRQSPRSRIGFLDKSMRFASPRHGPPRCTGWPAEWKTNL